jgi:hypothetical protein
VIIGVPLRTNVEGDAPRAQFMQEPAVASVGNLENSQSRPLIQQIVKFVSFRRAVVFDDNHIGLGLFQQSSEVRFIDRGTDDFHVGLRRDRVSEDLEQ